MTNLGSILKSRNIPLLTKVHLVKDTVFSVWIWELYECESWTIKKAEHQIIDVVFFLYFFFLYFLLFFNFTILYWFCHISTWIRHRFLNCSVREDSWESLWTARRSNQIILKEINPEYSLEGLMLKLKLQYSGHLMWRSDLLEMTIRLGKIEGRRRRVQTEDEMVGWHHQLDGYEFEQALGDGEGQRNLASCSPWGFKELDTTEQLNNNNNICSKSSLMREL